MASFNATYELEMFMKSDSCTGHPMEGVPAKLRLYYAEIGDEFAAELTREVERYTLLDTISTHHIGRSLPVPACLATILPILDNEILAYRTTLLATPSLSQSQLNSLTTDASPTAIASLYSHIFNQPCPWLTMTPPNTNSYLPSTPIKLAAIRTTTDPATAVKSRYVTKYMDYSPINHTQHVDASDNGYSPIASLSLATNCNSARNTRTTHFHPALPPHSDAHLRFANHSARPPTKRARIFPPCHSDTNNDLLSLKSTSPSALSSAVDSIVPISPSLYARLNVKSGLQARWASSLTDDEAYQQYHLRYHDVSNEAMYSPIAHLATTVSPFGGCEGTCDAECDAEALLQFPGDLSGGRSRSELSGVNDEATSARVQPVQGGVQNISIEVVTMSRNLKLQVRGSMAIDDLKDKVWQHTDVHPTAQALFMMPYGPELLDELTIANYNIESGCVIALRSALDLPTN